MVSSLFFRVLRLMVTSVLCSLPIYLAVMGKMPDKGVLLLSFIVFVIATGIDAYNFSFAFWAIQDYFVGQLLPLIIYIAAGFITRFTFQPVVFNRIFLPLRFAGCFGMETSGSIVVIGTVFIVIITVVRFFGARSGYLFDEIIDGEDEE